MSRNDKCEFCPNIFNILTGFALVCKAGSPFEAVFYEMIFFVDHDYHLKLPKGRTSVKSSLPVHELFLM